MVSTAINFAPTFTAPNRPLTWLITGCSSGLGLAIARYAQAAGHTIIATSRNPSRTPDLVTEITTHPTSPGKWLPLDLDKPTCGSIIADLEAQGVVVDVLVNNAGWSVHAPVEHFTEEEVRAQFETVFFGPYRLTRAAVAGMRRRRFGVVVNVSSGASLEGRDSMGVYAASKAAFDGLTKVLAKEVAEFNVRTLTVLLGGFKTGMAFTAKAGKEPIAEDYKGTLVDKTIQFMASGQFVGDGDPAKAAKAIYEVVVGEGVGKGTESELFLPLGREIEARVKLTRDRLGHAWEVFGDIAMNVYAHK
ncbi:hypothetical protein N0V93_001614 [Gnomoniopsis smithogilvyi]|uniref:Short-chain dehydrogenase n=1 Tax=Gnomoniopsis smithogilvyi TaxID=1191159 RepID=A0A9W8Z4A2_9PEZI|nr:hypothetical protein N0V93_001614 [Gnomoniopsis smithogilvyi]